MFLTALLLGFIALFIYLLTLPRPFTYPQQPEFFSLILTLIILVYCELIFLISLYISRKKQSLKTSYEQISKYDIKFFLINSIKSSVLALAISFFAVCLNYKIYEFLVINPPPENLAIGLMFLFLFCIVFVFTIFICFISKKLYRN